MQTILLTGAENALTNCLAETFGAKRYAGDPRDVDALRLALPGVSAVIHADAFEAPTLASAAEESDWIARTTLGTYTLCDEARKAGVERIIQIASLRLFDTCPRDYLIDEMWRPSPDTDPAILASWLAECSAREFAREGGINGICLRFFPMGDDPETETRLEDAVGAVGKALELPFKIPGYRWHIFHVASSPRYLMRDARNILGFERKETT